MSESSEPASVITYELEGDIALIGLNRPNKRNCMNDEMNRQFAVALARANDEAKCGVIFGHGDHFSAGLDLAEAMQ